MCCVFALFLYRFFIILVWILIVFCIFFQIVVFASFLYVAFFEFLALWHGVPTFVYEVGLLLCSVFALRTQGSGPLVAILMRIYRCGIARTMM